MKNLQTKTFLGILCMLVFIAMSCKKNNAGPFGVNGLVVKFTVPPTAAGNIVFASQQITFNTDSVLKANGLSNVKVTKATVDNLQFTILSPVGYNFNGYSNLSCYFSSSTQSPQLIAYAKAIPDSGFIYFPMPMDSNLITPFIDNNTFMFTAKANISTAITQTLTVQAKFNYSIYVSSN